MQVLSRYVLFRGLYSLLPLGEGVSPWLTDEGV